MFVTGISSECLYAERCKWEGEAITLYSRPIYTRDLDHYRYTARGRYRRLLERSPQVVQMLSLKDIASFLRSTSGRFAQQRTSHPSI